VGGSLAIRESQANKLLEAAFLYAPNGTFNNVSGDQTNNTTIVIVAVSPLSDRRVTTDRCVILILV
jgi:hypothetical protein